MSEIADLNDTLHSVQGETVPVSYEVEVEDLKLRDTESVNLETP
jgi:hypothetical protein